MTKLADALRELDEDLVNTLVDEKIAEGVSPVDIIQECSEGMMAVGDLFASGEYYLTELMFSADIMQAVMNTLKPLIDDSTAEKTHKGTIVIGTVVGDVHDIGKNIVVSLMQSHGFNVIDLGVNIPAEKFVEAVRESGAKIVGLSALLNSTYPEMKTVIDAFIEAGLRDQVKIIIGGTVTSETVRAFTGADAFATDAQTGVNFAKSVFA